MPDRTIQKLFTSCAEQLAASPQPLKNRKAINAISHCRTPEMGTSFYVCAERHEPIEQYHSCRHRSCYLCAQRKRMEWVEKQKSRLLNVPHYHVVFTMPHEYLNVWRYNESLMTGFIFKASQQTLMELLTDPRHQGFVPGILMALHTWGRQLTLHPHTHCLVTGGGLNAKGKWQDSGQYLLPIRVVKRLYRGKFQSLILDAYEQGVLRLPKGMHAIEFESIHHELYKKEWSVRIEDRYEHGKGVMLYLSRYLKGGPLNPKQLQFQGGDRVSMRYLDHRDKRLKQMQLSTTQLIKRLLDHVPATGTHTLRYYGLYAPSAKRRYEKALTQWGNLEGVKSCASLQIKSLILYCKTCGKPASLSYRKWKRKSEKGNSINKEDPEFRGKYLVQQDDHTNFAKVPVAKTPDT